VIVNEQTQKQHEKVNWKTWWCRNVASFSFENKIKNYISFKKQYNIYYLLILLYATCTVS
jgi:hypothetical protein